MYIIKSIRTITTPEGNGKYNYYDAEAKICITDEKEITKRKRMFSYTGKLLCIDFSMRVPMSPSMTQW